MATKQANSRQAKVGEHWKHQQMKGKKIRIAAIETGSWTGERIYTVVDGNGRTWSMYDDELRESYK